MNVVLQHYLIASLTVVINFSIASVVAWLMEWKDPHIGILRNKFIIIIIGTIILLIAAIGKLGWSIQTWNGNTSIEQLNNQIFWILSHLGSFLIFFEIMLGYFRRRNE